MDILKRIREIISRTHTLKDDERADMRTSFIAFMETRPLPAPAIRTPYTAVFMHHRVAYSGAFALLLATSIAYAAEGSLPNEPLYALKRHVTENVILTSALIAPELHARAEYMMLERRLNEVSLMLNDGTLEVEIATDLAAEITEHAQALHEYVQEATAEGDFSEALEIGLHAESAFGAHETILESLAEDGAEPTHALTQVLDEEQDRFELRNRDTKTTISGDIGPETTEEDVSESRAAADNAITDALEQFRTIPPTASNITEEIRDLITGAQDSYEEGTTSSAETSRDQTYITLQESIQQATEASILLEADKERTN